MLHPRASFESFADSVRNRCLPWLLYEVEDVTGLGRLVKDLCVRGLASSGIGDELRSNVLVQVRRS